MAHKNILAGQHKLGASHKFGYAVRFSLGLLYKQCQAPDLLISLLYIAVKPKQIEMVLPTIKYIFLHNYEMLGLEGHPNSIRGSQVMLILLNLTCFRSWFHMFYKITNFTTKIIETFLKMFGPTITSKEKVIFTVLYIHCIILTKNCMNGNLAIVLWKIPVCPFISTLIGMKQL